MDPDAITYYITDTFAGVAVVDDSGNSFFFYDPGGPLPPDRRLPFATLVTGDNYDDFSNLNRPLVFRLNIGLSKETYQALFGAQTPPSGTHDEGERNDDFTALDQIMPHPVYARQHWVCVLNPSATTFQGVRPLLAEAYDRAVERQVRVRQGRDS